MVVGNRLRKRGGGEKRTGSEMDYHKQAATVKYTDCIANVFTFIHKCMIDYAI